MFLHSYYKYTKCKYDKIIFFSEQLFLGLLFLVNVSINHFNEQNDDYSTSIILQLILIDDY